jgi:hypothetical protein
MRWRAERQQHPERAAPTRSTALRLRGGQAAESAG